MYARIKPDLIIYLHTTPQAAMKRIIARGRPEEAGIEIEYLARLHQKYEGWLTVTHAAPNPVLFYAAISHFLVLRVRAE